MNMCFTGHRPDSLPWGDDHTHPSHKRLLQMILEEIKAHISTGYNRFICGAAMGTDIEFGEQVLELRDHTQSRVSLICAIPFPNQPRSWPDHWQQRYNALLESSDEKVLISERFVRGCYHRRNRFMVDNADRILAVWDGRLDGGTTYTVKYAQKQGKTVIRIDPITMTRTILSPS